MLIEHLQLVHLVDQKYHAGIFIEGYHLKQIDFFQAVVGLELHFDRIVDRNRLGNFRDVFEEEHIAKLVLSELDFFLVVYFCYFSLVAFEVAENAFVLVAQNLTIL